MLERVRFFFLRDLIDDDGNHSIVVSESLTRFVKVLDDAVHCYRATLMSRFSISFPFINILEM